MPGDTASAFGSELVEGGTKWVWIRVEGRQGERALGEIGERGAWAAGLRQGAESTQGRGGEARGQPGQRGEGRGQPGWG